MWHYIAQAIATETQQSFIIKDKKSIANGTVGRYYRISAGDRQYFVKIHNKDHLAHFRAEALSLKQIQSTKQITCPKVIALGSYIDKSFLVLTYIPFSHPEPKTWYKLGQQLALMHKKSQHKRCGWQQNNFIGDSQQPNKWHSQWQQFFSEQRIVWQLRLLSKKSVLLGDIQHISKVCQQLLQHHKVTPCLVHGDLWRGNIGFYQNNPVIFDPACYYGDREVDLAMTELFGFFPSDFYQGYHDTYPLDKGYEVRKTMYNLYHILNHANLFGGIYIKQAKAMLTRLLSFTQLTGTGGVAKYIN